MFIRDKLAFHSAFMKDRCRSMVSLITSNNGRTLFKELHDELFSKA